MFFQYVNTTELEKRLDAPVYDPKVLFIRRMVKKMGGRNLEDLCIKIESGPFGSNAKADDFYSDKGLSFIRPVNISSNVFSDEQIVFVPKDLIEEAGLKIYHGENIYFGRVGNPCVAYINGETSISPNIIIGVVDSTIADAAFLYIQCASFIGILQLLSQLKVVAQPTTGTIAVKKMWCLTPNLQAQKYIGNKVRQAESLRDLKKSNITYVRDILDQELPGHPEISPLNNTISSKVLRNQGWGCRAYRKHRLNLREAIKQRSHSKVADIASIKSGCPVPGKEMKREDVSIPLIKNGDIKEFTFDNPTKDMISAEYYVQNPNYHAKSGMVVVCLDGEIRAQYFLDEDLPALVNQRVAMVQPIGNTPQEERPISPELLSAWLNHPCLQEQLLQWSVKTTVEHISNEIVKDVLIPRMTKDVEDKLTQRIKTYRQADYYAHKLTTAAKYLVEALIEQKITEEDLIKAQEALEDGDITKDKAILKRLTVQGLDVVDAQPLFPDIDRLYELLQQSNSEEEDDSSEDSSEESGET